MKIFFKILKLVGELVFLAAAFFIGLYLAYYFGWTLLPQSVYFGNDIPSALNNIYYLESWYPLIPRWNYLWYGGIPNMQIYPMLPFVLTFLIHKFYGLSIMSSMKLVMFFSLPLAAAGVGVLGRILTKNWWVGLLASGMMLLSADSWLWITEGGFFAVASSVPFFAWALVVFCLAIEKGRSWLLIPAAITYGLTWLFHPTSGMLLTVVMLIMGFGYGVKLYGRKKSLHAVFQTLMVIVLGIGLFAWWIFPFFTREDIGGITIGADQMYRVTIREILGLDIPKDVVYITSTFYTASVVILFLLGSVVAFLRRSILRWAVFACVFAIFIMTAPYYAQPVVKMFQIFWASTNVRSGLILRILGPVIAAYGAISIARPVFFAIEHYKKGLKKKTYWLYFTETISGVVGLLVLLYLLQAVVVIPPFKWGGDRRLNYNGYGPYRNWINVKELNGQFVVNTDKTKPDFFEPLFKSPKEIIKDLPNIVNLTGGDLSGYSDARIKKIVQVTGVTDKDRVETVPMGGRFVEEFNNSSQVSQVQGYIGTSLIQRMIGWQVACTYVNDTCSSEAVADLIRWFGVGQIWAEGKEPKTFPKFDPKIFKRQVVSLGMFDGVESFINTYSLDEDIGLASITNKSALLIIGDNPPNNDVFDIVFRGLSLVDFGYKNAWSVKGKRFIDDYSPDELRKFEVIVLHGYQYHNREKAWSLLENYVKDGGALFADTGWKYLDKDWGKEEREIIKDLEMPGILPVSKTTWTKTNGKSWNLSLGNDPITKDISLADWGKPLWVNSPWEVAYAQKSDLKEGAVSILENDGKVLTASWKMGKGRVVWTGFNFWGHLISYKALDERNLVHNILVWLTEGNSSKEMRLDFERKTPDHVAIDFKTLSGNNKLMFKEVASSNWGAVIKSSQGDFSSKIYKAGPGWKLIFIPANVSSGEVRFDYGKNRVEWLGIFTSVIALLSIVLYYIQRVLKINLLGHSFKKAKTLLVSNKNKIKETWKDDEEY